MRVEELLAERIEKRTRVHLLSAIRKKLPPTLSRLDIEMAASDYFDRLGHDNHRRMCGVYGWPEKKSKTPGAANPWITKPLPDGPCER